MSRITLFALLACALIAGCTRDNKEFCCTSAEDCASVGVTDDHRDCAEGLSCVEHSCSPSACATAGCTASAPTCDVKIDVCSGCTTSAECARFVATPVCEPTSGACLGCVLPTDCGGTSPVCEATACRGCKLDQECPSGACGVDGSCVPEAQIVYVAPNGADSVPCSKAQPCRDPIFATQQTNGSRQHLVFAAGNYTVGNNSLWNVGPGVTTAPALVIHGGGARISTADADGFVTIMVPTQMRDLELMNTAGFALRVQTISTIENVKIRGGYNALLTNGSLSLLRSSVESTGCGVVLEGGSLRIDGAVITGGINGMCVVASTTVDLTNLLVYNTTGTGLDLPQTTGMISFSTISATGVSGTGPTAVRCTTSALQFISSIGWTPGLNRPVIETCSVSSSLVGPVGIAGGTNLDPSFVSPSGNNFHINGGSPAVDMANSGPARDFEGDTRPKGARFDIGADEAP